MAVNVWVGTATDQDWNTVANWSLGAVPVNNDDVVFNGEGADGNEDCTANCDPAIVLDSLTVGPDYIGTIGNPAAGLKLSPTSIGNFYYEATGDALCYMDTTITTAIIRNTGTAADPFELDGVITDLVILRGDVDLVAGANVARLFVSYLRNRSTDVDLTIPAGVFLNTVTVNGSQTTTSSGMGVLYIYGGEVTLEAGDLGQLDIANGTLNYNADGNLYTLGIANIYGGALRATDDPLPKVITAMTVWTGGQADLRNGMNNVSVTNGVDILGGKVFWDPGTNVT